MKRENCNRATLPANASPPALIVTEAGRQTLLLRALVRQAIPILQNPEAHSPTRRRELAQTLTRALDGTAERTAPVEDILPPPGDLDAPPDELEYEPGCLLEETDWEELPAGTRSACDG